MIEVRDLLLLHCGIRKYTYAQDNARYTMTFTVLLDPTYFPYHSSHLSNEVTRFVHSA
jgi:hypothetical protein